MEAVVGGREGASDMKIKREASIRWPKETFCKSKQASKKKKKKKKPQCKTSFKSRDLGSKGDAGKHHTSAFRSIGTTSRTKVLWRGKQDGLADNVTVKFQFYLREGSFIKSHD